MKYLGYSELTKRLYILPASHRQPKIDITEDVEEYLEMKANESKMHECKYCGAMTTQPDEECWNYPGNIKYADGEDDIAADFHKANEYQTYSQNTVIEFAKYYHGHIMETSKPPFKKRKSILDLFKEYAENKNK